MVRVDVLGHPYTLACEVKANADPHQLRDVLKELQQSAAHITGDTTLVLIAPYLSPEAQALCNESHAGFLDLEGNARIAIAIGRFPLPRGRAARSTARAPPGISRAP